jgi:hypothetical protein
MSCFSTKDDMEHLSVQYENIYIIDGTLTYLTTDRATRLPSVSKWTSHYNWQPAIKVFPSKMDIDAFVSNLKGVVTIDLALYGDMVWCHNIGHALFDGLYPMYAAMVKFGYKDEPCTVFTDLNVDDKGQALAKEVTETFSGNKLYNYHTLDRSIVYHCKKLISGTGGTGNRVITKEYTLYGETQYNAVTYFKERMYKMYDLTVDKPMRSRLQAIIVKNKRYSASEVAAMNAVIRDASDIDIRWVDWQTYPSFREQLRVIQDTDIHITGPGTGMMYMPFLKKGAVNVNLGYMERTQTNGARPNLKIANTTIADFVLPAYLEQSVCAGARYVNTVYYDRYVFNDIEQAPLRATIEKAIQLVGTQAENNIHIDGLIFKEYCKRSKYPNEICNHLTGIAFMIELFVHEHPDAVLKPFVELELLRGIKQGFHYGSKYDILPKLK